MIRPTDRNELIRLKKKRGHYFMNAVHIPLSQKYHLSIDCIECIRDFAIHRKMNRKDICLYITNALNNNAYDLNEFRQAKKPSRQQALAFLLRCKEEEFKEITRLTKYDWDNPLSGGEGEI